MRRAATHIFRAGRCRPLRNLRRVPQPPFTANYGVAPRAISFPRRTVAITPATLQSSMHFRNLSLAFISTLVASGAWYAYKGSQGTGGIPSPLGSNNSLVSPTGIQSRGVSSTAASIISAEETAEATRRALLVENEQFYASNIVGSGPLSKETDSSGRRVLEMLTPEQATQKLRRNEESYLVGRGRGVVRYDVVQLPSNDPIEDDHAEKIVEVPQSVAASEDSTTTSDWMFWGVFDGHSGWTTSAKLRQALISFVARELNATYKSAAADPSKTFPSPEAVDNAIKSGFVRLDHEIVHESVNKVMKSNSKRVAAELLAPALSGSCALLAFYDSRSNLLRVACTGDSRAVLGRRAASGKWVATPLSEDQTGSTQSEVERLTREHPGEPNVVRNGRILGNLEPSRAFGDAFYKWTRETQDKIKRQFFGRTPHQLLKTPPYVTAEPVITTTPVEPRNGDFVVLATDGLWEMLSNEEVVGLVGQWIEHQRSLAQGTQGAAKSWLQGWFRSESNLPVENLGTGKSSGQRLPIRQQQYNIPSTSDRFAVEDKNAATHLVRNALGGKDQDMVCALLTLPSPYSRRYRDDLTVEVIFFGEGPDTGDVTLNTEASANSTEMKAKL
ncbi:pyruvate dehydrogenase phosphatase [Histoplasma capsulatum G186AR]|uniref:Pyruvate dehydrogenase phosphatase n=2 Tax=Ajellomyces capsulatus TaxID=5037 RepID=C0NGD6_AJECG|nr:pyruvate dehydrogenase phosphatase [Histoplasma capsulatum G186AR]EEH08871.1 pyruvate dehydrogenase phosphatase [Histoplasma capsulatum G186AR]KAG5303813.1 pyruvate dehydrogenase phosphatase [Histoplasma capsulatum]QSS69411.1 pyruvate dehydrogenase phosphatase [Histoplasma capsulatum G186AR]